MGGGRDIPEEESLEVGVAFASESEEALGAHRPGSLLSGSSRVGAGKGRSGGSGLGARARHLGHTAARRSV